MWSAEKGGGVIYEGALLSSENTKSKQEEMVTAVSNPRTI